VRDVGVILEDRGISTEGIMHKIASFVEHKRRGRRTTSVGIQTIGHIKDMMDGLQSTSRQLSDDPLDHILYRVAVRPEGSMTVVSSTPRMLGVLLTSKSVHVDGMRQDDRASPMIVTMAVRDGRRRLHQCVIGVSRVESTQTYQDLFRLVREMTDQSLNRQWLPDFVVSDGLPFMSAVVRPSLRIMCFWHMLENVQLELNRDEKVLFDNDLRCLRRCYSRIHFEGCLQDLRHKWAQKRNLMNYMERTYFGNQCELSLFARARLPDPSVPISMVNNVSECTNSALRPRIDPRWTFTELLTQMVNYVRGSSVLRRPGRYDVCPSSPFLTNP
jgi:hypothetical protein